MFTPSLRRLRAIIAREQRAGCVHTAAFMRANYLRPLLRQYAGHTRPKRR
jgi:hypothetical protein